MFFLHRRTHVGPGDSFADGGGIRCVVLAALAAHAVGVTNLGAMSRTELAVLPEASRPVVSTGTGFHADQAGRGAGRSRAGSCSRVTWV